MKRIMLVLEDENFDELKAKKDIKGIGSWEDFIYWCVINKKLRPKCS